MAEADCGCKVELGDEELHAYPCCEEHSIALTAVAEDTAERTGRTCVITLPAVELEIVPPEPEARCVKCGRTSSWRDGGRTPMGWRVMHTLAANGLVCPMCWS